TFLKKKEKEKKKQLIDGNTFIISKSKKWERYPENDETTSIIHGFNTLLPYFHNNFSSIFTQYFWSYAWRTEFKYLVHTTPIELLTYYKGHFINLPDNMQYKYLFENIRKGNQFLYLTAHSFKDYKKFVGLNKYLQN